MHTPPQTSLPPRSPGLLALGAGLLVAACSTEPAGYTHINEALAPLATADLVPGEGLGPIRPGETTLGEAVRSYGPGHVSIVFGDEITAIDLSYASRQLHLQFQIPAQKAYGLATPLTQAARDLEVYLAQEPSLDGVLLSGLTLGVPKRLKEGQLPWWRGSLGTAKLGGTLADLTRSMPGTEQTETIPMLIPGQDPDLPARTAGFPDVGVYVHLSDPAMAKDAYRFANEVAEEIDQESQASLGTLKQVVTIGEPKIVYLTQMAEEHY